MSKKVIKIQKTRHRVIEPEVPSLVETYIEEVPMTVYECDFCTREQLPCRDEYPSCISCGKHACYFCHNRNLEEMWFQIGTASDTSGDYVEYWTEESDDYRFGDFRICEECIKNPPDKIKGLIDTMRAREMVESMLNTATGKVIDEIERLKNK